MFYIFKKRVINDVKLDQTSSSRPSLATDASLFSKECDLSTSPQKAQSVIIDILSSISINN